MMKSAIWILFAACIYAKNSVHVGGHDNGSGNNHQNNGNGNDNHGSNGNHGSNQGGNGVGKGVGNGPDNGKGPHPECDTVECVHEGNGNGDDNDHPGNCMGDECHHQGDHDHNKDNDALGGNQGFFGNDDGFILAAALLTNNNNQAAPVQVVHVVNENGYITFFPTSTTQTAPVPQLVAMCPFGSPVPGFMCSYTGTGCPADLQCTYNLEYEYYCCPVALGKIVLQHTALLALPAPPLP